jgi:hypothetical protein
VKERDTFPEEVEDGSIENPRDGNDEIPDFLKGILEESRRRKGYTSVEPRLGPRQRAMAGIAEPWEEETQRLNRKVQKLEKRLQVGEDAPAARPVGQGNTRKPRNVHHDPLKALIGTTKRDHPGISHRDLCRGLDVKRVELPRGSTWQKKSGERSWIGNCDCDAVRPLMDTYFSKIPPASPERKNTK